MSNGASRAAKRLWSDPAGKTGFLLLSVLLLFAIGGPTFVGHDPNASDLSLTRSVYGAPPGPSAQHWLGSDTLFRDLLARLAVGTRLSLAIALGAALIASLIGTVVGVISGYYAGRWPDRLITALSDMALAFPYLLLITAIGVAMTDVSATSVMLILGFTGWPGFARIIRSATSTVMNHDYVRAARALGRSNVGIMMKHVLPALLGTLLVLASQSAAAMILAEAVLSYLTVGVPPPQASLGRMLHEAQHYMGVAPLLVAAPAIAILWAVLAITQLAEGLARTIEAHKTPPVPIRQPPTEVIILVFAMAVAAVAQPVGLSAPLASANSALPPRTPLRLATHVPVYQLDPAMAYDQASRDVLDLVVGRLLRPDERGELVPHLAEHVTTSIDGLRYSITLRSGLQFHDGTALEAIDVKRSLERTLHPKTPCPVASLYSAIEGYDAYRKGADDNLSGIAVTAPTKLTISLSRPDASFAAALSMSFAAPVCKSMGPTANRKAPALPCGAGPFRVATFERGSRLHLRRFEHYHVASLPRIGGIDMQFGVSARTQRYRFEAGELDILRDMSGVDTARFASASAWSQQRAWVTGSIVNGIFLNTELRPFDNRHLRRAVALAIDRRAIPTINPRASATTQLCPTSMLPVDAPNPSTMKPDLVGALRQMDLAGYPYNPKTKEGGYPYPIRYTTVSGMFPQTAAELYQQQLARIGIRIEIERMSWAAYLAHVSKRGRAVMGWRGWGADYPDPSTFYEPTLTTSAIRETGGQNLSFFSNPQFDALVAEADRTASASERMTLFRRIEKLIAHEAPWIPVHNPRALHVWQARVKRYHPASRFALEKLSLDEAPR